MRVCIIGDGQLGKVMREALSKRHYVNVYSRSAGFDFTHVHTAEGIAAAYDVVVNCAAMTDVDACETARQEAIEANVILPTTLAHACVNVCTRLIHISTDYVYGRTAEACPTALLDENAERNPMNFYGETKAVADKSIIRLIEDGCLQGLVLRPAWLYSAVGNNFLTKTIECLKTHAGVKMADDQHAIPTSAYAVAKVAEEWIDGMFMSGEYNICSTFDLSAPPPSRYDIACWIKECIGSNCTIARGKASDFPSKARRQLGSCLSTMKLERELCARRATCFKLKDWREDIADAIKKIGK